MGTTTTETTYSDAQTEQTTQSTTAAPVELSEGSGQSVGGTADALPAAPAIPQDRYGVAGYNEGESVRDTPEIGGTPRVDLPPIEPWVQQNAGVERSLVHQEAPELAAAAMAANQQPAPTDPIEQIVSQLHTRVTALEDMAAQPSTIAEIASLRSALDSVISWMETQAPMIDKVAHLFNVHWAGKIPEATGNKG